MQLTPAHLGLRVITRGGDVHILVKNPNRNRHRFPFKAGSYSYGSNGKWCCGPQTENYDLDIVDFVTPHEMGCKPSKIPPRPFMKPAVESELTKALKILLGRK